MVVVVVVVLVVVVVVVLIMVVVRVVEWRMVRWLRCEGPAVMISWRFGELGGRWSTRAYPKVPPS